MMSAGSPFKEFFIFFYFCPTHVLFIRIIYIFSHLSESLLVIKPHGSKKSKKDLNDILCISQIFSQFEMPTKSPSSEKNYISTKIYTVKL